MRSGSNAYLRVGDRTITGEITGFRKFYFLQTFDDWFDFFWALPGRPAFHLTEGLGELEINIHRNHRRRFSKKNMSRLNQIIPAMLSLKIRYRSNSYFTKSKYGKRSISYESY